MRIKFFLYLALALILVWLISPMFRVKTSQVYPNVTDEEVTTNPIFAYQFSTANTILSGCDVSPYMKNEQGSNIQSAMANGNVIYPEQSLASGGIINTGATVYCFLGGPSLGGEIVVLRYNRLQRSYRVGQNDHGEQERAQLFERFLGAMAPSVLEIEKHRPANTSR